MMDHENPGKDYRPEDEYETLESAQEQIDQARQAPAPEVKEPQNTPNAVRQEPPRTQATRPQQQRTAPNPAGVYRNMPPQGVPYQPIMYPQPMQQPAPYPYQLHTPIYPQAYQPMQQIPVQPQTPMSQQIPVQQAPTPQQAPAASNPYVESPQAPQQAPAAPKPSTPTGTKVFIIILCTLLVSMIFAFTAYVANSAKDNAKTKNNKKQPSSSAVEGDDEDDNGGFSYSLPFNGDFGGDYSGSYSPLTEKITLKADKGETQQRDDDNPDTVGKPDANAKSITLKQLPSDTSSSKYNTQSAYKSLCDSVVTVVCYQGSITDNAEDIVSQGSGTIISSDGYLITNAHVIGNSKAYAINIVMNNGEKHQAKVIGYDTWSDLAVLKIEAKNLKAVTFGDSELIEIGQDVITIGSPGGAKFQNSLTKGVVSAVDRELSVNKYVRYIQSDAAISPGSSGGPLCNIYGQVIGITTAKAVATYYENMSFSIPSATVEDIVNDIIHFGYVKGRARIGFSGTETGSDYAGAPVGILISQIDENGALAGTGIKPGDIVVEFDGKTVTTFQDIYDILAKHKPGDKVSIKVQSPDN